MNKLHGIFVLLVALSGLAVAMADENYDSGNGYSDDYRNPSSDLPPPSPPPQQNDVQYNEPSSGNTETIAVPPPPASYNENE